MPLFSKSEPPRSTLEILGLPVCVIRRKQKNLYLSVRPDGSLRVTCPHSAADSEITAFVTSQADWLRKKRAAALQMQDAPLDCSDGTSLPLWGKFYTLKINFQRPYSAFVKENALFLNTPEDASADERAALLASFYRGQMADAAAPLLRHWQTILGVSVSSYAIHSMTTRWGSCSTGLKKINLNLKLVTKDPRCLEYIIVHELCHLIVPDHSARFWNCVARCLPDWERLRKLTNEPVKKPDALDENASDKFHPEQHRAHAEQR